MRLPNRSTIWLRARGRKNVAVECTGFGSWLTHRLPAIGALVLSAVNCFAAPARPDLVLSDVAAPVPASLGELVTFNLSLTNRGNATATQVLLSSTFSSNATIFSAAVSQGSYTQAAGVVTFNLGSIAVGAGATIRVVVTPIAVGTITNSASVSEAETDSSPADNTATRTVLVVPLTFYAGPNLNLGRSYHTATLLADGRVLFVGGITATGNTATAELYNPQTKTFTLTGNMLSSRSSHAATRLNDGTVLITGISAADWPFAELYNPTNGTFTAVGNVSSPHISHTSTLLPDGRVLIAGSEYIPMNAAEIYVPGTRAFTNTGSMNGSGYYHRAILLDEGKVLIAGGTGGWGWDISAWANLYDPAAGSFLVLTQLNYSRIWCGLEKLADGRALVAGGGFGSRTVDLYTPASRTFTTLTNQMRAPHGFATANRLPDGKVLVAGSSALAELFDPASGGFLRAAEMRVARNFYSATPLTDGTILFAGGNPADGGAQLASTEIYDPARTKAPPAVSIGNASLVEGNAGPTNLIFNLSLASPMGVPVSVAYTTAWGSAAGGEDFADTNGVIVFPPGNTNQTLSVTVFGDVNYESDETFTVNLSSPTNAVIDVATGTGTIFNDDPIPTLTAAPAFLYEGNRFTSNLVFNLSLSGLSYQDVTVDYATVDGTASAGSDYVATNGTAVIPAGSTNQTIAVMVKGDIQVEPNETFALQFSNVVNALPGTASVTGTMLDDDGAPGWLNHFEIALPAAPRLAGGPLPFTILAKDLSGNLATNFNGRVLLSIGTTNEAPQHYGFEDGVLGDWTPANGGQQPGPYEVKFFDVNGDGEFSFAFRTAAGIGTDGITRQVALTGGRRYYVSGDFAQSDEGGGNNGGGTVAYLSLGGATLGTAYFGGVNSGDVLRTNLSGIFDAPVSGSYTLGLQFARNPWFEYYPVGAFADDVILSAAPITPRFTANFANGVWSGTNVINLPGANYVLRAEDVEGHLGDSLAFNLEQPANVALLAAVAPSPPRVGVNFTITLTATNLGPGTAPSVVMTNLLPVGPSFVSAASSAGTNSLSAGVVTSDLGSLSAGQTATLTLTLRAATFGTVTNFAALVPSPYDLISSNDTVVSAIAISPALLSAAGSSVVEPTGGTTNVNFTVTVGDPHSDTIEVDYATVDLTATNGADYLATSGHLIFPPGVSTQIVSVTVLDDTLPELSETFRLQLSNPVNANLSGSGFGTGTILGDGDPLPQVTINDVTLLEGDSGTTNAVFTVSFSRPAGYSLLLSYATTNGTAVSTNDYVPANGTLTFTAGQTNKTITVGVRGNTVNEPDEVFYVNLSTNRQGGGPVILLDAQAVCTILNDDLIPGRLDHFEWTVSAPRVVGLPFAVTLTARDAFNNVATNTLGSIPISATATVSGKPAAITISPTAATPFVAGVWNGNITISAMNTNVILRADDGQEHIGLSSAFDVLPLITTRLALTGGTNEGAGVLAGQGSLTVSLARNANTTFNLASSDTTELTVPATVVLSANTTNVSFDLTVADDTILDGTKCVTINASALGYTTTNAEFAVHDNEIAMLTLSAPSNTTESASLTGTVFMSAPAGDDVAVALTSSDPTQLTVPACVTIPAGQNSNTFGITPVNDLLLDGPQTVLITAHVENWTNGATAVTVRDDETNTVTISFAPPGPTYYEGVGAVSNATVRLGGIVGSNLTVLLTSSDATEAIVPVSVMIPAGTNSVFLPLAIPDDALFDGTQTALLTPTAPGFVSLPVTVTVGDNELHHFNLSALPAIIEAGVPVAFMFSARDINNATMTGFPDVVTLTATNTSGAVPMSPTSVTLTAGQWGGNLNFPNWEYGGVRLVVSSGGVAAQSSLFNVVPPTLSVVNAGGSELVYSPLNGRLYVNTPSGYVTPINAVQAQVESSVFIGSLGSRMVASDDGQFLYLEQTAGNLCRFNVSANTADLFWSAGAPQIGDMAAVPGMPTAVVIVRYDPYYSTPSRGTVMFNNGVALPGSGGGSAIDFAAPTRRLYTYNGETTAFNTDVFDVDANGLNYVKSLGMMAGFHVDFVGRGGLLFAGSGQVFNPDRAIAIGGNPAGMMIASDIAEGRFYYWQNIGGGQSAIVASDLHTLLPIGSTTLPGVSTAAGSLIRWGTNGLAFRPNASQVAVVRSAWVPSGPSADLVLTQLSASSPAQVGGNYTCMFAVSNAGPGLATNVILTATQPATISAISASSSNGTSTVLFGGVSCAVPSLPSGASATVTLTLTPSKPGPFAFKVGVLSSAPDPNLTNNRLSLNAPALFVTGYDSVIELALTASDLVYDPAHARICASVPNASELLGNSIVTFDPLSGLYPSLIPTAVEPAKLAVADNGQYLYAALGSEPSIQRVNLTTRVADLKFPTGYNGVYDMEVMPGNAGVVAATVHTTVAVYENGVKRSNVVAPTEYNFGYNLEFGANSNRLYASFPRGFRRIAVDSNGATLIEDVRDLLVSSYNYDFDFDAGLIYTIDGRVFNPETKTMVATVPYGGLVVADASTGRAYYLTTSGGVGTIHVLDMPSLTQIKTITVPGIGGSPVSFIRWGADGLAFRTTAGQVFLIRDTSVNDHDWDGLDDAWESQYFGSINGVGGGSNEDPDGDGLINFDEFRAGTNPLDPQSYLRIGAVQKIGTQPRVSFPTATGRRYRVERSPTLLSGSWATIADNLQGTGGTLEVTDATSGNNAAFYRLVLLP